MISVIIPVYNTKQYLDRCISSVVNQTYRNLEIFLIDDHSTDGSSDMLDVWAKKDDRIRVIHKEKNEGVSAARNTGLLEAKGEYVAFVDSDDCIEPEMYEQLHFWIDKTKADIAFGGFTRIGVTETFSMQPSMASGTVISVEEAFKHCIPQRGKGKYDLYIWDKLYRLKSLCSKGSILLFDADFRHSEDMIWSVNALLNASSVVCWQGIGYVYNAQRDGNTWTSLLRHDNLSYVEDAIRANLIIYKKLRRNRISSANNAYQRVLYYIRQAYITADNIGDAKKYYIYTRRYSLGLVKWLMHDRTRPGYRWYQRCMKKHRNYMENECSLNDRKKAG